MNTPESLNSGSKGFLKLLSKNWENIDESQKNILKKIWKVITYKWQLQILLNLPFLIWWALDNKVSQVHEFDVKIISYLNLPEWALSLIGFGQ